MLGTVVVDVEQGAVVLGAPPGEVWSGGGWKYDDETAGPGGGAEEGTGAWWGWAG